MIRFAFFSIDSLVTTGPFPALLVSTRIKIVTAAVFVDCADFNRLILITDDFWWTKRHAFGFLRTQLLEL
jgi:hypothetical protein